jgi:hypothetical protein
MRPFLSTVICARPSAELPTTAANGGDDDTSGSADAVGEHSNNR